MSEERGTSASKVLSRNDTGETRSHQDGICLPKDPRIFALFPQLSTEGMNPCSMLTFRAPDGRDWEFRYIYYNNAFYGGTRNEYRLTRMVSFIRAYGARAGDRLVFSRVGAIVSLALERVPASQAPESGRQRKSGGRASWHIILTEEDMAKWKEKRQE
jgi:hypothetical protein